MKNNWIPSKDTHQPEAPMQPITNASAWTPDTFQGHEWMYELDPQESSDLVALGKELSNTPEHLISKITRNDVEIGKIKSKIDEIKNEIQDGRGFALIRGLETDDLTLKELSIIFWSLGISIGEPKSQNQSGHLLGHVKNLGGDYSKVRGYLTSDEMGFHADSADILTLCCINPAKSGGEHRICSSTSVYNHLLENHPWAVEELMFRFYNENKAYDPSLGNEKTVRIPIFSFTSGYFAARGPGAHIMKAQKIEGVPKLTDKQLEAINLFKETAKKLALDIDFQPGDISYVNNHVTLHSRTKFEDYDDENKKRHLFRMWLSTNSRPLHSDIKRELKGVKVTKSENPTPVHI